MDKIKIRKSRIILKTLKFIRAVLWVVASVCISVFLFYWLVWFEAFGPLPDKEGLKQIKNANATLVYSSDDHLIGKIFEQNRSDVAYSEFPSNLVNALVATEDARFFRHDGIDNRSLLRVVFKSLLLGDESSGGGSTITQQLAKNLYGRHDFGFLSMPVNKVKEMILAERIEGIYSKEQILELYLNTVSFSENVYGIEEGSRRFFGKHVTELKTEESAVLVGILKANTYYNPRINPSNAIERRNVVLYLMHKHDYITGEVKDSLQKLPLLLTYKNLTTNSPAGYFLKEVEDKAIELLKEKEKNNGKPYDLKNDGLRIHTTLNYEMQNYAQQAVYEHMYKLQELFDKHWGGEVPWKGRMDVFDYYLKRSRSYRNLKARELSEDSLDHYLNIKKPVIVYHSGRDSSMEMSIRDSVGYYLKMLNCAFMAMHPSDGKILAYIGGLDYHFLPFNHVKAQRQSASTFKPIVYATALERGVDPCDFISNERRSYPSYDNWSPRNYDNNYDGLYSMKGALKKSINVAAVKTVFKAGINNVVTKARDMGIESKLPSSPSVALGTGSVTLYEMVRAYGVFPNDGKAVNPYMIEKITAQNGEILYERKVNESPRSVISKETATLISEMLQSVVNEGTGYKLRSQYNLKNNLAGKTGTAQNYTDGWFIGYNPEIVAGVWVGAPSPVVHFKTGTYGSGAAMALPVFGKFFQYMNEDEDMENYTSAKFDPLSEEQSAKLDCPDFREGDLLIDKFYDLFRDNEEGEPMERTEDIEKENLFERLFKKK